MSKAGIGKLNDGDVALISNVVARISAAQDITQTPILVLTDFEMSAVYKAGLMALSKEAGRDSIPAMRAQVETLRLELIRINEKTRAPKRATLGKVVAEVHTLATEALRGLSQDEGGANEDPGE